MKKTPGEITGFKRGVSPKESMDIGLISQTMKIIGVRVDLEIYNKHTRGSYRSRYILDKRNFTSLDRIAALLEGDSIPFWKLFRYFKIVQGELNFAPTDWFSIWRKCRKTERKEVSIVGIRSSGYEYKTEHTQGVDRVIDMNLLTTPEEARKFEVSGKSIKAVQLPNGSVYRMGSGIKKLTK